jgi:hypothetical protein
MLERSSSTRFAAAFIIALGAVCAFAADREDLQGISKPSLERGRYIAQIAGCNDCHTPNYAQSGGRVPEKDWLIGDRLGWRGPWGTTYPANLRMTMARMSEEDWVRVARSAQVSSANALVRPARHERNRPARALPLRAFARCRRRARAGLRAARQRTAWRCRAVPDAASIAAEGLNAAARSL